MKKFSVLLTNDFYTASGDQKYADVGLDRFDGQPQIDVGQIADFRAILGADQIAGANGVVVMTPKVTRETLAGADDLLAIARFGVGYDSVDVPACTAADVLVAITIGAVDRPVAEAVIGWMIALAHQVRPKHRLVCEAKWDDRPLYMGRELRDRTLGLIGFGRIARKVVELLAGWGLREVLAFDPHSDAASAAQAGVRLVGLEEVLRASDFVSVHCPLNDSTRGLLGRRELEQMRPDAFLINTARGGIVDEDALYELLKSQRIAGAAVDVFAGEPLAAPSRLCELENVLLAPHSIAWTDECFRDMGHMACQALVDLSLRRVPEGLVNPEVLERDGFRRKWERICG